MFSAALGPREEVPSFILGSKSRSADLYLPHWRHGKPTALNVIVISPLQKLTLQCAVTTQGHALDVGEERKLASYSSACHPAGIFFVPLVVKSFGGWSREAVETIKTIVCLQGQHLGIPTTEPFPTSSKSLLFSCGEEMCVCGPLESLLTCPW